MDLILGQIFYDHSVIIIIIIIVFIQSKDKNTYPKLQWKSIIRYAIKYNSNIR